MSHDFDDLVETDGLEPAERARLARAHELLVAAGPPAELSPSLELPPAPPAPAPRESERPSRRFRLPRVGLAVAAAAAVACLALGYVIGDRLGDALDAERVVAMAGDQGATGTLRVGKPDEAGNRVLEFSVEGLPAHTSDRGYYELFLERDGEPTIPCGGFRLVEGAESRTSSFRFLVPYSIDDEDRWVLTTIEPGEIRWPGEIVMTTIS